jgi:hypothetical protein
MHFSDNRVGDFVLEAGVLTSRKWWIPWISANRDRRFCRVGHCDEEHSCDHA